MKTTINKAVLPLFLMLLMAGVGNGSADSVSPVVVGTYNDSANKVGCTYTFKNNTSMGVWLELGYAGDQIDGVYVDAYSNADITLGGFAVSGSLASVSIVEGYKKLGIWPLSGVGVVKCGGTATISIGTSGISKGKPILTWDK